MGRTRKLLENIIGDGIKNGEFKAETNPHQMALFFISSLEGSLMMSKLFDDMTPLKTVSDQLDAHIDSM